MAKLKRAFVEALRRYYLLWIACLAVFSFFNHMNGYDVPVSLGRGLAQTVAVYAVVGLILFLRANRFR
ncbi:MAG: hypothetical protein QM667_11800 [Asticcacaulis sp.]